MKNRENEPEMPRVCAFCDKAQSLSDDEHMLCSKKGVVACGYSCRKFRYDPLKRVPHAPIRTHLDIAEIEESDDASLPSAEDTVEKESVTDNLEKTSEGANVSDDISEDRTDKIQEQPSQS